MHAEDPGDHEEYAEQPEQSRSASMQQTGHRHKTTEQGGLHSQYPPSVHTGR
ncbi:hypothetical protein GCM10009804_48240 [Kribbella hippodromi]|uniref:Uncharacterized protein n=1 Tax=Kribbella hippodromi TaxID=434347 RepID=A0ABN2DTU0_9ACTN